MLMNIGPFMVYRVEKVGTLCISLTRLDSWACGWQYGWRDDMRGSDKPLIELRIGRLMVLYLEFNRGVFEWWVLGFWGMLSYKTKRRNK